MDRDSFTVYIKTDDIYKYIVENVKTWSYTSNYELDRLLPKGKNEIVIRIMKWKLVDKSWQNVLEQEQKFIVT